MFLKNADAGKSEPRRHWETFASNIKSPVEKQLSKLLAIIFEASL